MPGLLILTVGTGTAGRESNLAQGLVNTIDQIAPRAYWLIPSQAEASRTVADIIREERPQTFRAWSNQDLYCCVDRPDDLQVCKDVLQEAIQAIKHELRDGESLVLNPVSGTKQMSAGATLAAVSEGVGRLVFTVGERLDGVVRTGTERIAEFDIARYLARDDLAVAQGFFAEGAFDAACRVLDLHVQAFPDLTHPRDLCRLMHLWQRGDWKQACGLSKRMSFPADARAMRRHLDQLAIIPTDSVQMEETLWAQFCEFVVACEASLGWNEPEDALGRLYRAAEHLGKTLLFAQFDLLSPYSREALARCFPDYPLYGEGNMVAIGLREVWRLLRSGNPSAPNLLDHPKLWDILQHRNQTWIGHGHETADRDRVELGRIALMDLARCYRPDIANHAAFTVRPNPRDLSIEGF